MDKTTFIALMAEARVLNSVVPAANAYVGGYMRGLRRAYHSEPFGTDDEHVIWLKLGTGGDPRIEAGQGYRDGLAGVRPAWPAE